ncbi:MAG: hypothetical protein ACKVP7_05215 [Hyphomicrobiaceae bacterium]
MAATRKNGLRRLVRVMEILYRQHAAEVSQLRYAHDSTAKAAVDAVERLDERSQMGAQLANIALLRAARLRRSTDESEARLTAQLAVASESLISLNGVECRLAAEQQRLHQMEAQRGMDDLLELIVRPRAASLE